MLVECGGWEKALGWGVKTSCWVVMPRAVELPSSSSSEMSDEASSDAEDGGPEGLFSWW